MNLFCIGDEVIISPVSWLDEAIHNEKAVVTYSLNSSFYQVKILTGTLKDDVVWLDADRNEMKMHKQRGS